MFVTEVGKFGKPTIWEPISSFFSQALGQTVSFQEKMIFADARKVWEPALRITIEGTRTFNLGVAELFSLADAFFGKPRPSNHVLWPSPDGLAEIRPVEYPFVERN